MKRIVTRPWMALSAVALTLAAGLLLWRVGRARAEGPPTREPLWFAGTLVESGVPVDGPRDFVIGLFDAETEGAEVCSTTAAAVPVNGGRFRVALRDPDCRNAVAASADLWVEVRVGDTTLRRTKIGAVPYALEAGRATEARSLAVAARREMTGVGEVWNCRLDYASVTGTLSIVARDGTPLSAANPCLVGVTDGVVAEFDASASVVLAADVNTFGSTAGRGWAFDRPFFLAVCSGSEAGRDFFGITLNPIRATSASAIAEICLPRGGARCDAQNSLLVMDESISPPSELDRPCRVVGSFRATKNPSDQWTVSAPLNQATDGIGRFQNGARFRMPTGQNGAVSGQYLVGRLGDTTIPTWASPGTYQYWLDRFGTVHITFLQTSRPCTPGSGTDLTGLALPYVALATGISSAVPAGVVYATGSARHAGTIEPVAGEAWAYITEDSPAIHLDAWQSDSFIYVGDVPFAAFAP